MNKFKFSGVGQGLFYAGTLINGMFNFVFDCGTSNNKAYIDRYIDGYIYEIAHGENKPHIHLAVISHLHKDHFSGLPKLAENALIDKIYLPYLGQNKDFIKFALAYTIFYNSNDDIVNANQYRNDLLLYAYMLKLYGIVDDLHNEIDDDIAIPKQIQYCTSNDGEKINHGIGEVNVICLEGIWRFEIYYRHFNSEIINDLVSQIKEYVHDFYSFTLIDFILNSKDAIKNIAKCYEAVFGRTNHHKLEGGINMSSAVMIHYPLYYGAYALIHNGNEDKSDIIINSVVTVLTGDAKNFTNYPNLDKALKDKRILFFQVPHHGAKDNWESIMKDGILACDIDYFVVPFGLGNSYGHPNVSTLDYFVKSNKKFYNITQLNSLEYAILG